MNKQQLAAKIWRTANKMRSKIEANEYKDYILGFIFYKFLSDKEIIFLKQEGIEGDELKTITEDNIEVVDYVQQNLGYFIDYNNLFSTWLELGRQFSVSMVRDALSAFDRKISPNHKKLFEKIFDTLQTGLSKLGATDIERSSAIRDIIALIKDIPTDGRQDYDVLGFVYEYLISNFAANAGKKAGEFYTPYEVSVLMSDIIAHHLRDKEEIKIYDPTSGSGSLLINIGKSVSRHVDDNSQIKYYAQELKLNTYNLTRMNLIMRGINPSNIEARNGDTLKEDWPYFDESDPAGTYEPLYIDAVVSNPPYSQEWDPTGQDSDPRYSDFGLAPKGCADFAFLLHDLYHVKPQGIMTIVLPHGVLYRGGSEYTIRKELVEHNHIDTIIGLPEKVFFGTGISTIVMVLKRDSKVDDNILFIDASRCFEKDGKNNRLRACDIKKIVDAVTERNETPDFARLVSRKTIRENDYNLNISRYVDSSDKAEKWDIFATMFGGIPNDEISSLSKYWEAFPTLKEQLFSFDKNGYAHLSVDNIESTIYKNDDVNSLIKKFYQHFYDFPELIKEQVVDKFLTLKEQQTKASVTNNLFARHDDLPLIDPYKSFQFFSNEWETIANDIEILQTESFDAIRKIDPNMIIKNNEEVQDGWVGRILPFSLVQKELLPDELNTLKGKEQRMTDISERLTAIIELLPPDALEKPILNDDNTKWVAGELKKEVKKIVSEIETPEILLLRQFPSRKADKVAFIESHPEIDWDSVPRTAKGDVNATQISAYITTLQRQVELPADSYEQLVVEAFDLVDEEKELKKEVKSLAEELNAKTIQTIELIDDDTAIELLKHKWIRPIMSSFELLPKEVMTELAEKVQHISNKYAITYQDIANKISKSESKLSELIAELQGGDSDILGLAEFRKSLNVNNDGKE